MTRSDVWQQRARSERGLILQILYASSCPDVDLRTIEGAARTVRMPIEPEHLAAHLRDMVQRGYLSESTSRVFGLRLVTYALLPLGRDIILGATEDASIVLPADQE
jgi:hypothetical protein